jgi:hypothetical protein
MINKCRAFADEKKRYEVIGLHYYLLIDHYFRTIYFEIVYGSNTRQSYIIKLFQIFNFFSVFFFFRFVPSIFFSVNFFFCQLDGSAGSYEVTKKKSQIIGMDRITLEFK